MKKEDFSRSMIGGFPFTNQLLVDYIIKYNRLTSSQGLKNMFAGIRELIAAGEMLSILLIDTFMLRNPGRIEFLLLAKFKWSSLM